jgi:hypothetical protein
MSWSLELAMACYCKINAHPAPSVRGKTTLCASISALSARVKSRARTGAKDRTLSARVKSRARTGAKNRTLSRES